MYEPSGGNKSLSQSNLQFIQNKPCKMMNGRQLRRTMLKRNKTRTTIQQSNKGFVTTN